MFGPYERDGLTSYRHLLLTLSFCLGPSFQRNPAYFSLLRRETKFFCSRRYDNKNSTINIFLLICRCGMSLVECFIFIIVYVCNSDAMDFLRFEFCITRIKKMYVTERKYVVRAIFSLQCFRQTIFSCVFSSLFFLFLSLRALFSTSYLRK